MREFSCWCYAQPTTTKADACGVCGWPKSHHHDNTRRSVTTEVPDASGLGPDPVLTLAARRVVELWLNGVIVLPRLSEANAALLALRRALGDYAHSGSPVEADR